MELLPIKADRFLTRHDLNMAEELLSPTQRSPLGKSPSLSPRDFDQGNDAHSRNSPMNPNLYTQDNRYEDQFKKVNFHSDRKSSVSVLTGA